MKNRITVSEIGEWYKINVQSIGKQMSTGYIVGMVLGFIFLLIIGIIMLILWLVKSNNDINIDIVISKKNWKEELDKQMLIYNFGSDTNAIKLEIENKIKTLNK